MKKIILILTVSIALFSCSNESKMKAEIKSYLDKNAKDPKSYEFVELKIVDTVTTEKITKDKIDNTKLSMDEILKDNINQTDLINSYPTLDNNEQYLKIEANLKEYKALENDKKLLEIELKKQSKNKEIKGYIAFHKCRLKNGFGALDLTEYYVEFDKDFKLLQLDKDIDYSVFK